MSATPRLSLPQPDELSEREKDDAMAAYLMMFASWAIGLPFPLVNLVASIIYYALNRRSSAFVEFHALQALLFHVPVTIVNCATLAWLVVGLATDSAFGGAFFACLACAVLVNVLYVVLSIIALTRALRGRFFYLPLAGRLAFRSAYRPRSTGSREHENRPPEGL